VSYHSRGRDFISFLCVVTVCYFVFRGVQRRRAARQPTDDVPIPSAPAAPAAPVAEARPISRPPLPMVSGSPRPSVGKAVLRIFVAAMIGAAAAMTLGYQGNFDRVVKNDDILATVPIGGMFAGLGLVLILVLRAFRRLGLGPQSARMFQVRAAWL